MGASRGGGAKKAIRRVERVEAAAVAAGRPLTQWEETFLGDLRTRLDRYGRAFGDPEKGDLSGPFSVLQERSLRQIQKAGNSERRRDGSFGAGRSGFNRRKRKTDDGAVGGEGSQ